jgi:hypothetical protein
MLIRSEKIGFLQKTIPDHVVVKKGLVSVSSYLLPTPLARSVEKKGIRVMIMGYAARRNYSVQR